MGSPRLFRFHRPSGTVPTPPVAALLLLLFGVAAGGASWAQAVPDVADGDSTPTATAAAPQPGGGKTEASPATTVDADAATPLSAAPPTPSAAAPDPGSTAPAPPSGTGANTDAMAADVEPADPPVATRAEEAAAAEAPSLAAALAALADRSFQVKQAAAEAIAASGDARAVDFLKALLAGDLYYRTDDDRIVFAERSDAGWALTDALTGEPLGEVGRRDARKITVNNRMRTALRTDIATLTLASPDAALRLSAAREMVGTTDADTLAALEAQLPAEEDTAVRAAIELALAIAGLNAASADARLDAVAALGDSLDPQARNALDDLIRAEQDPAVLAAAQAARAQTEQRVENMRRLETLFFGLSLGSVLVLAAIGLAITFGVMGVINMAHGELIMLGAYTTYLVQLAMPNAIDYSLFVAIPMAFVVAGLFGVAIERGVIRFLYGRPLETLLATFGISLVLQQLVRTTISAQNVIVENPSWMSGSLQLNPALSLTFNRLYIFIFALIVFVALLLVLKRTALGLQVRAVSQNRAMARAMGVRSGRVDALTFGLGAGIAGVAGVALSQLTNVGPNMGQAYIIDSFMVVVFGGVGNLWGTLVGGLSLGVANKFMEPWTGAVLAKILVLVFIILFIQWRPRGLFPQRGRAADG